MQYHHENTSKKENTVIDSKQHAIQFDHIFDRLFKCLIVSLTLKVVMTIGLLLKFSSAILFSIKILSSISLLFLITITVNYIILLLALAENWNYNRHLNHALIFLIIDLVVTIIAWLANINGMIDELLSNSIGAITLLFYICIAYAMKDYGSEVNNKKIVLTAHRCILFFIVLLIAEIITIVLPIDSYHKSLIVNLLMIPAKIEYLVLLCY